MDIPVGDIQLPGYVGIIKDPWWLADQLHPITDPQVTTVRSELSTFSTLKNVPFFGKRRKHVVFVAMYT